MTEIVGKIELNNNYSNIWPWNSFLGVVGENHQRYAKVRKWTPKQFEDAFKLNLETGKPFDEIVDESE